MSKCERCGACDAETYRQRTQYAEEEWNWVTLCPPCREENDACWEEMWAKYYYGGL